MSRFVAFAIYGSSQLFCVVWQVVLLASFAVITYAYLRIEELQNLGNPLLYGVITYAYLRIEELVCAGFSAGFSVITYAYLRIEDGKTTRRIQQLTVITYAYLRIEEICLPLSTSSSITL